MPPFAILCLVMALGFQRGVNFTSESGYSPTASLATLDKLPTYGVNAIALVPYGFERRNDPEIRFLPAGGMEREADMLALSTLAHARGMKVLLKPQIWLRGGFPGDIDFPNLTERTHWLLPTSASSFTSPISPPSRKPTSSRSASSSST